MAKRPTRSEQESYRLLFFIVAQLIMGSMIWLVFQETFTRRPWKDHQLGWFEVERARAALNLDSEKAFLKTGVDKRVVDGQEVELKVGERAAELEKKIAELEGAIIDSPARVEFEKLKKDLKEAEVKLKDEEIKVAFAKAYEDEAYYFYRDAKHHGDAAAEAKYAKQLEEKHQAVLDRSKDYDAQSAVRDAISDKVGAIQAELAKAKKEYAELSDGVTTAQRALDSTKERWTGIEQFWNQEMDLVDRCHTCHMGYDKCGYSKPEEIVSSLIAHPMTAKDVKKRFCVTREEADRYVAASEKIKDSWGSGEELTFEKVKGDLKLDQDPIIAVATRMNVKPEAAEALYRTHPHDREIFSNHPPQRYGCTSCHYGQGRQTKGVGLNYLAGFTAPFDHAEHDHYWEAQMLQGKQTEASCFNCHKEDYELKLADNLTEGRKLVQHLGCTGCHPLGPLDPERKHGPTLTKVASKIDPAYLVTWIQNPHALRPRTRMPNFWPTGVSKDGTIDTTVTNCDEFDYSKGAPFAPAHDTNCAENRDRESAYIAAFLLKESAHEEYPPLPASASADRGKVVFEEIGCMGCHNMNEWTEASHMPGSKDRDFAPNLTGVGAKVRQPGWFYAWVKNPRNYWHETRMPKLRLTDEQAWDVAAYLSSQKGDRQFELSDKVKGYMAEQDADAKGKKLLSYYGCFGCHEVNGFEAMARVGADLTEFGSKLPSKLDFGDVEEFVSDPHNETWEKWLKKKLKQPRIYRYERAAVRMPQFDVSDEEMEAAVLFLKSQNTYTSKMPEQVKRRMTPEASAIQRGALLVDSFNCRGCHMIDDRGIDVDGDHVLDGGDIYRRLAANEDEKFRAPPKLMREGAKVYPDWLFAFLKEPTKLRENYKIHMPTFQFTDDQAKDLVAYFAAKAGKPYPFIEKKHDLLSAADEATAKQLFSEAQCLNCHNLGGGSNDPKNVAPNLRLAAARLQYDWIFDWLKNPQEQIPGVSMPNFFSPVDDKPGEYETPLTDLADGNWRRQIELLRAMVISLGAEKGGAVAQAATAPKPAAPPRRGRGR